MSDTPIDTTPLVTGLLRKINADMDAAEEMGAEVPASVPMKQMIDLARTLERRNAELRGALTQLVALADSDPFTTIGHAIEHVVPQAKAALSGAKGGEMSKRKNPVVWVSRDKPYCSFVELRSREPVFNGRIWVEKTGDAFLIDACYRQFARITGLKLKPGECKRIRINVEVVDE